MVERLGEYSSQRIENLFFPKNEQFVEIGAERVRYFVFGVGPDVFFLHGWIGHSPESFYKVAPLLFEHFKVWAFDLLSLGKKDSIKEPTIENDAQRTIDFANTLGIAEFSLVGHSRGGTVVLKVSHQIPQRIKKLIVNSAPVWMSDLPSDLQKLVRFRQISRFFAPLIVRKFVLPRLDRSADVRRLEPQDQHRLREGLIELTKQPRHLIQTALGIIRNDVAKLASQIQVPTLVLEGEDSRFIKPSGARRLSQLLPKSKLVMIPECGHNLILEKPAEFAKHMTSFLQE